MRDRRLHASSTFVVLGLLALSGCTMPADVAPQSEVVPSEAATTPETPGPSASASLAEEPAESPWITLTFEAGASLEPGTSIDWANGFGNDSEWTLNPKARIPGFWAYNNSDKSCVAMFYQRTPAVLGDAPDRESSDASISSVLHGDFTPALVTDARTELSGQKGGEVTMRGGIVEYRRYVSIEGDHGVFVAARAFQRAGIALVTEVQCDGADIESIADEVLSNNVMSIEQ